MRKHDPTRTKLPVVDTDRQIEQQCCFIARLERDGHDAAPARAALAQLEKDRARLVCGTVSQSQQPEIRWQHRRAGIPAREYLFPAASLQKDKDPIVPA
jgi:hypothetical protein